MKKLFLALLLAVTSSAQMWAQDINYSNWMKDLDDNLFLARLSIPGSHNACTSGMIGSAHCQTFTVAQQLENGVRMFDLRPRVNGGELKIYHGILGTGIKFNDVLNTLCSFLDSHPDEFLFVIMRHEDDGANQSEKDQWPSKMYDALNAKRSHIIDYSPTLTVKEMRGKLLVMSRNSYNNGPIGAYLNGGSDNSVYDRTIVGPTGAFMNFTTQDMYDVAESGQLTNKQTEIKNLLNRSISENEADYRLYMNHTSGYSKKTFGISTAAGVQECAKTCNKTIVDYMPGKVGPMGFIMMDFAADDTYYGKQLVDLIINNNFALMAREHANEGYITKGDKKFILPMGADCDWTARYIFKTAVDGGALDNLANPSGNWTAIDYDDSSWTSGLHMPIGSNSFKAPYRTQWDGEYNCYWLRREFTLDKAKGSSAFYLKCYHDDDYEIYVNGKKVDSADGWTNPGGPVIKEVKGLVKGKNVIAVKQQQNWGAAYFDFGIYEVENVYVVDPDKKGDINEDNLRTITDVMLTTDILLKGEYNPAADMDDDGEITSEDVKKVVEEVLK